MRHLQIPYLPFLKEDHTIDDISEMLEGLDKTPIEICPWGRYAFTPEVKFSIGYSDNAILLKYNVSERHVKAIHRSINEPVYKDSCVEFFIAFNNDPEYYNLEFNCAGVCLAGYGPDKTARELLPVDLIELIQSKKAFKSFTDDEYIHWDLTLMIPLMVFFKHDITSLNEMNCRINFYKCGDDLPEPHYLSWTDILSDQPDFHLPQFFGRGVFSANGNTFPLDTLQITI